LECHEIASYHTTKQNCYHHFKDLLFDICRNKSKHVAESVAVLLWIIWQNRNDYDQNNNKSSAQQMGMQAAHMWKECAMVQLKR
jgi:hypothetical protein